MTALVTGCAEFDRRGGVVAEIEDAVFFRADTKTHRLLRSYLLATVLLTAARRQGQNDVDRTAIAGALEGALAVANESYVCLYPGLYQTKGTVPEKYFPLTYPTQLQWAPDAVTPAKPDAATPAKPGPAASAKTNAAAPAKSDAATPAKPDAAAPAKSDAVTPAKPGAAAPAKPDAVTPAKPDVVVTPPKEVVDYSKPTNFPLSAGYGADYQPPKICQFFDERMARLDYALYRLASVTLFNDAARQTLGDIRSQLIGKIPVLSDAAVAAIHANKAVGQASTVLDDLLNLAFNSFGPVLALLPLYRDSLELNMWVIADNLRIYCGAQERQFNRSYVFTDYRNAAPTFSFDTPCETFAYEMQILNRGNGNLKTWQDFTRQMNAQVGDNVSLQVEAYRPHFLLISQLLVRSCRAVLSDSSDARRCEKVLVGALELAAFNMDNATGTGVMDRQLLASAPLPGARLMLARSRAAPLPADVRVTGSIAASPKAAVPAP